LYADDDDVICEAKRVYKEESGEVKMEEKDKVRWGNKKSPLVI